MVVTRPGIHGDGDDDQYSIEDYIEAYVPVTLLGRVSEQPGVLRVRAIVPPQPARSDLPFGGQSAP